MVDLLPRAFRVSLLVCAAVTCGLASSGCDLGDQGDQGAAGDQSGAGQGPGRRSETLALSPKQELQLGTEAFDQVKSESRVVGGDDLILVKKVGDNIFKEALTNEPLQREINLHVKGWYWNKREYAVLDKNEINAFCLPGGKVAVYTGLLRMTAGKEDWLATVLSHEIAHALAHHASERIAREHMHGQAMDAMSGLDALGSADQNKLSILLGMGGKLGELSFDRQQESEADHIGVFLMAFAGYNPDQAVRFWEEMEKQSRGSHIPEILSDHPSDARRVAQIKAWSVNAENAIQAWKAGRIAPPTDH